MKLSVAIERVKEFDDVRGAIRALPVPHHVRIALFAILDQAQQDAYPGLADAVTRRLGHGEKVVVHDGRIVSIDFGDPGFGGNGLRWIEFVDSSLVEIEDPKRR